ncbi:sulfonate ABC transporter permease [Geoanaerobacter pelophilus]|uniref:Sulfonate ABC transporter permease n=1 Tax=Geoanaerobacter pelophilus TaxID=60036 RepID=A0ABQ0MLA1_9BACT|nr:ABC transporter permease subunit [Geoanaerobacter pelophilus]GAW67862.1 sulfonate ABC transporter permease [Geoanaerobacter pelophilus]
MANRSTPLDKTTGRAAPNLWDFAAFLLVMGLVTLFAWGSREMALPYTPGERIPLSLDPIHLPEYALRTVLRMAAALALSLLFTFSYGTLAAKSRRAERILVPLLNILQSVPILGFLSVTVTGFIALFPGRLLGVECAAIFAIFTSQAWNMAFSFYQSLKTIPTDLNEASVLFGLSPWQRFWKLEAPFAMPPLVWNMMMSVSGGWFFVVASEAITVGKTSVTLPGIGSYVAQAIHYRSLSAIGWALFTMLLVILVYDQLLFRPMVAWADKFKFETTESGEGSGSWLLTLFQRARLLRAASRFALDRWIRLTDRLPRRKQRGSFHVGTPAAISRPQEAAWNAALAIGVAGGAWLLVRFVGGEVDGTEIGKVFYLGFLTLARVTVLLIVASLIWVPIGVAIGLNPKWATRVQPLAQFLAAFPANLFFPVAVFFMVHYHLSPEIWTAPLMILGTQWYILFNVIGGASAIPTDLREAARNFGVSGWKLWKTLLLPGIFPSLVTGLVTAAGGTWNASIVAEIVTWGNTTLTATGLGSYIAVWTEKGDYPRIALGIAVMSIYVVVLNRFFWQKLFTVSQTRYRLG